MKKLTIFAVILGGLASSAMALETITFQSTSYRATSGGEFAVVTSGNGNFNTFCLEKTELIGFGTEFEYEVSDRAKLGGAGTGNIGENFDILSVGSAHLYGLFSKGTLLDYFGSDRKANSGLLQNAFWALEHEISLADPSTNKFLDLVINKYGSFEAAQADYTGTAVGVMNVYDSSRNHKQDQLVRVPDGGMTLSLLGLALAGLATIKRRFFV